MSKDGHLKQAAKAVVEADKQVTHRLARYRDHPAVRLSGWAGELADQPPLIALSLATLSAGLLARRPEWARGGARMLAAHLAATGARAVVKNLVDRARPNHALDTGDDRFERGDGADDKALNSFPSGHTAGAVAVARAATRDLDGIATGAAIATGAVVAVQAPSGHHYLLDMVAGAAIGWACEAAVSAVFDRVAPAAGRVVEERAG